MVRLDLNPKTRVLKKGEIQRHKYTKCGGHMKTDALP